MEKIAAGKSDAAESIIRRRSRYFAVFLFLAVSVCVLAVLKSMSEMCVCPCGISFGSFF